MGINVWVFSMGILNRECKRGYCMGILERVLYGDLTTVFKMVIY